MAAPSCKDCPDPGACCRYYHDLLVGVLLTEEESSRFPEAIATRIGYFLPLKPGTAECLFLDNGGLCSVHANREPEACRTWHCVDDFDEQGEPSRFLQDHPDILRWLLSLKKRPLFPNVA